MSSFYRLNIAGNCLQHQKCLTTSGSESYCRIMSNLTVKLPPLPGLVPASPKRTDIVSLCITVMLFPETQRTSISCCPLVRSNLEFLPDKHELLQWAGQRANPDQYLNRIHVGSKYRIVINVPYDVLDLRPFHRITDITEKIRRHTAQLHSLMFIFQGCFSWQTVGFLNQSLAKDPRSPRYDNKSTLDMGSSFNTSHSRYDI